MKSKIKKHRTSSDRKHLKVSSIGEFVGVGVGVAVAVGASVVIPNVGFIVAIPLAAGLTGIIHKCYTSATN